jgi:hypothetical protein
VQSRRKAQVTGLRQVCSIHQNSRFCAQSSDLIIYSGVVRGHDDQQNLLCWGVFCCPYRIKISGLKHAAFDAQEFRCSEFIKILMKCRCNHRDLSARLQQPARPSDGHSTTTDHNAVAALNL